MLTKKNKTGALGAFPLQMIGSLFIMQRLWASSNFPVFERVFFFKMHTFGYLLTSKNITVAIPSSCSLPLPVILISCKRKPLWESLKVISQLIAEGFFWPACAQLMKSTADWNSKSIYRSGPPSS